MKLYYHPRSGHSHRAHVFLAILGIDCELITVDLKGHQNRTPEFLAINSFAQIPVLDDDGVIVPDSNAIMVYLAKKFGRTDWLPETPREAAAVQRWLSAAAGELYRGPCSARMFTVWGDDLDADLAIRRAHEFLQLLNAELRSREWLAGNHPTIADLAHYAYVAHAPEGNVDISKYGNVTAWLVRVRALPGFVPLLETLAGLKDPASDFLGGEP
jgi:glutathione S-transferase